MAISWAGRPKRASGASMASKPSESSVGVVVSRMSEPTMRARPKRTVYRIAAHTPPSVMRMGPATSSSLPVCTKIRLNSERNARKKTSGLTDAATRPTGTRLAATTPTEKAAPAAS